MSVGWVAGTVRARALVATLPGAALATAVADSATLDAAADHLGATLYGELVGPGMSLMQLQRSLEATLLWRMRVLAGWVPFGGSTMVRALAGWFEIRVIEERLGALTCVAAPSPHVLGRLGAVTARVGAAQSPQALRAILAASPWRDPGEVSAASLHAYLLGRWAARVIDAVPAARPWVDEAVALAARREVRAGRSSELAAEAEDEDDLWQREQHWWEHVETDARRMMRRPLGSPEIVVAACALMAADAHHVATSLEAAARSGERLGHADVAG